MILVWSIARGSFPPGASTRDWPHQVALPVEAVRGRNTTIIQRFCRGLSICQRHRRYGHGEDERIAYCFAERLDAEFFQMHFGGEFIDPCRPPK